MGLESNGDMADATTGSGSNTGTRVSRRRVLGTAGLGATTALAGCNGFLGGGGNDTVKVGFALATSGTYSLIGNTIIDGFKLRADTQLDGQIGGREVEYVQRDTEGDPGTGAQIATEYIDSENVDFIVGAVSGAVSQAIYGVVNERPGEVLWLNPNGTGNVFVTDQCLEYHFITTNVGWQLGGAPAQWVLDNLGDRAILTYADYGPGREYTGSFETEFTNAGGEIVQQVPIPLGADDYTPRLQQLTDVDADVVFSFFAGGDAINYINDFHSLGLGDQFAQCGPGFLLSTDVLPAQGDAAVGKHSYLHYTPTLQTERNQTFVQNYQAENDRVPNVYACMGYDTAQVANKAVTEIDGTNADDLVSQIRGIEVDSPRGYFQMDPARHHAIHDVQIREVVEGEGDAPPHNEVVSSIDRVQSPWTCF